MRWIIPACLLLAAAVPAAAQVLLVSAEREQELRSYLPALADEYEQARLDGDLILYDKAAMPKTYQHGRSAHWAGYNISGERTERAKGNGNGGNANVEFPWRVAGGLDQAEDTTSTFHFYAPPKDEAGQILPIVYWWDGAKYRWVNPVGATYGEVMLTQDTAGEWRPFELRTRTREIQEWGVDIFRPFPTAESLAAAVRGLPGWEDDAALARTVAHLESRYAGEVSRIVDRSHPDESAFDSGAVLVDDLPDLPPETVDRLLDRPFASALGVEWRPGMLGWRCVAPVAHGEGQIVPQNYRAAFLGNDRFGCIRCHEHTNRPADDFDFRRDWYGRVRGSDGIFTMHPFEPAQISRNGYNAGYTFRKEFLDSGVFAKYDPDEHPSTLYKSIEGLE